jgi:hypothetical protein
MFIFMAHMIILETAEGGTTRKSGSSGTISASILSRMHRVSGWMASAFHAN